jgi:hypothetical protein
MSLRVPSLVNNDASSKLDVPSFRLQQHEDIHNSSTAILGLQDWEIASILGNQDAKSAEASCNPPSHVSKTCCIGSFSMGGDIDYRLRYNCNMTTLKDYLNLQKHASRVLSSQPDDLGCDVCQIYQICRQNNLTIAFFGDSMSNQVVQGLVCEFQRRNYLVSTEQIPGRKDTCKRCIKWTLNVNITSPQTSESPVQMKFFFQYRYPFYYPNEEILVATSADVLVTNLGLHWSWNGRMYETGRMHYRKSMHHLFRNLQAYGSYQLLIHRETSAQHFDASGGDWGLRRPTSLRQCVPHNKNESVVGRWREEKVSQATRRLNHTIVMLPWWDYTAQHHEMHPREECSHYCSSPFLYYPLWRGLRRAMDDNFANDKL